MFTPRLFGNIVSQFAKRQATNNISKCSSKLQLETSNTVNKFCGLGKRFSTITEQKSIEKVEEEKYEKYILGKITKKLKLCFTCKRCNSRNMKIISKLSYEKGVVIVRCDGCKNNHLVADNLGWFPETHYRKNIESILKEKGETVRRIRNDEAGYFEAVLEEEVKQIELQMNVEPESLPPKPVEETKEIEIEYKKDNIPKEQ